MAWVIKYWDHIQSGHVYDVGAGASTIVPFCGSFTGLPVVLSAYVNCEGGTTCHSAVSTASFTLHTGLAGTVNWLAVYNSTC